MDLESVERLTRDIKTAARTLSDDEARFLVDAYYMMQEDRKRAANQVRALDASHEPNAVLQWFARQSEILEDQIKRALDAYTEAHEMGSWMRQIVGIGPVISAGFLAHLSLDPWRCAHTRRPNIEHGEVNPYFDEKAKSCHEHEPHGKECQRIIVEVTADWWRFAGLDPTSVWEKGQRRPWNARLKTLCWKAGQSFMKFSNRDDCYYGKVYRQRKEYEIARNERGDNTETAKRLIQKVGKSTEAYKAYAQGKLPAGQIDARARRYAVKLFIAHLHDAWYIRKFKKSPPAPYPIAHLGHKDYIPAPV